MQIEIKSQSVVYHGVNASAEVIDIGDSKFSVVVWKEHLGTQYIATKIDLIGFDSMMFYVSEQIAVKKD